MELSKRYCKVILEKKDENGVIEDSQEFDSTNNNMLDVKFNYTRYLANGMHSTGRISICGLNKSTIDLYTSFKSQDVEILKRKTVTVFAGYDKSVLGQDSVGKILSGTIINALPTQPPDVWLDCEVISEYEAKLESNTYNFTGEKTLQEVLEWAVEQISTGDIKYELVNRIDDNEYLRKTVNKCEFEGNKFDFISKIGADFYSLIKKDKNMKNRNGIVTYIEDNKVIADYQDLLLADYDRDGKPLVVSKDNEQLRLIGIPKPDWAGQAVNITTLLNPSIKTGQVLELKTDLIKALSGYYFVHKINYTGEFRGTNWYSHFFCRRLK